MNTPNMMQAMAAFNTFRSNHPKFIQFFQMVFSSGVPVDTVVEITVTKPGEEPITTNIKVKESDLQLFNSLKGSI